VEKPHEPTLVTEEKPREKQKRRRENDRTRTLLQLRRKEGAEMKITIEISDNAICGFLNLVEFTGSGMQMVSFQLGSGDLVDGKTTKLPREMEDENE
jgi:hypothetical protein